MREAVNALAIKSANDAAVVVAVVVWLRYKADRGLELAAGRGPADAAPEVAAGGLSPNSPSTSLAISSTPLFVIRRALRVMSQSLPSSADRKSVV